MVVVVVVGGGGGGGRVVVVVVVEGVVVVVTLTWVVVEDLDLVARALTLGEAKTVLEMVIVSGS